jgi:hypothetical protein
MEDNVARILGEPGHDVTVHTEPRIAPTPDQADRIPHPHARLRGRDQRQRRPFHLDEPATLMLRVLLERAAARRPVKDASGNVASRTRRMTLRR